MQIFLLIVGEIAEIRGEKVRRAVQKLYGTHGCSRGERMPSNGLSEHRIERGGAHAPRRDVIYIAGPAVKITAKETTNLAIGSCEYGTLIMAKGYWL